jgi:AcrR family transcriptional regulator
MMELCAERGYHAVSVAGVSSRAQVSSATFYAEFDGKEDCLLAAYQAAAGRLFGEMGQLLGSRDWSAAARGALETLLRGVEREPAAAHVLLVEARGAGPRLAEERLRTLETLEASIDRFLDLGAMKGDTLDIPARAIFGGVRGLIIRHLLARAEDELPAVLDDMLAWLGSYAVPGGERRFSTGPAAMLSDAAIEPSVIMNARPKALPRGRHRLPPGVVARSRRTRLVYATAEVSMVKGYAEMTVADIVAAAGVARDVFYEHFTDKQDAFLQAQQHPTQHILEECAKAYFAAADWPERVWEGLRTLIALIVSNPAISHLRLVGCYAAGPAAIRRAEEITRAFTVFVEEGYGYSPRARALPRLCSEAITSAMFETIQRHVARGEPQALQRSVPRLTYIVIAPFTGPRQAADLVGALSARAESAARV